MEHTERITRRQLLGLSAVAAGSLLIPSIAYGSAESEDSPSPQKNGPICHATLLDKDGNLIASTEKDSFARSASGNFKLEDSLQTKINSDGTITDTYAVEVFEISNARQGSFDRTPIYYIEYDDILHNGWKHQNNERKRHGNKKCFIRIVSGQQGSRCPSGNRR